MSHQREISSCIEISPSTRTLLIQKGFRTVNDVLSVSLHDLSEELHLSLQEVASLVRNIEATSILPFKLSVEGDKESKSPIILSAAELFEREHQAPRLSTSSLAIDELLGNGIPFNKITEFCGLPGTGKTQLAMQLTVNTILFNEAHLPSWVIYIDTEGGFHLERIISMIEAKVISSSMDNLLKYIIYIRAVTKQELMAALYHILNLMQTHSIRLVVIDSIAFLLRYDGNSSYQERVRLSNLIGQLLNQILLTENPLAIVITNHLTQNYNKDKIGGPSQLVPTLSKYK
jgi:RAD51-like protein 2